MIFFKWFSGCNLLIFIKFYPMKTYMNSWRSCWSADITVIWTEFKSRRFQRIGSILIANSICTFIHFEIMPKIKFSPKLGCHPWPRPSPVRAQIPESGSVIRDRNQGSSTHCVLDPSPGPVRDPCPGPGRVADDNQAPKVQRFYIKMDKLKSHVDRLGSSVTKMKFDWNLLVVQLYP